MDKKVIVGVGLAASLLVGGIIGYNIYLNKSEPSSPALETTSPSLAGPTATGTIESSSPTDKEYSPAKTLPEGVISSTSKPSSGPTSLEPEALKEEETKKEPASVPESKQFGVLVGKFRTYQEASKLMAKLQKQGKQSYISPSPGKPARYEVWVGPFRREAQAQAEAKSIKTKYGQATRVQQIEILPPK
ncbi:MAG: hypothetical protein BZ151_06485 [Desulfobacca sp. 4484_104]|nr:MAG: hypothetical protein BZ151_06485 [Desulfobacca sp. 4484_104]RLA87821.1 MAG: hypothetical protein DRG58_09785 [Deltaproteobacteria bacterium]